MFTRLFLASLLTLTVSTQVFALPPIIYLPIIQVNDNRDAATLAELAGDGKCQLREAVEAFNTGTSVDACGYAPDANQASIELQADAPTYTLVSTLNINNPSGTLLIYGYSISSARIIAAQSHFTVQADTTLQLHSLTLSDGNADHGGSINNAGNLEIEQVRFLSNHAVDGGAIYNTGRLAVSNSEFISNGASNKGGALYTADTAYASLNRTLIQANQADVAGGGIYVDNAYSMQLHNSMIGKNLSPSGCALASPTASVELANDQISMNCSSETDTTIAAGALDLYNVTLTNNTGIGYSGAGAHAYNSIISDNSASDCDTSNLSGPPYLYANNSWIGDDTCNGSTAGSAPLTALADHGGTFLSQLPLPGSALIDAGTNGYKPSDIYDLSATSPVSDFSTDMRGDVDRIVNGTIDLGATESATTTNTAPHSDSSPPFELPFDANAPIPDADITLSVGITDNYAVDYSHLKAGDVEIWLNGSYYGITDFKLHDGDKTTVYGKDFPDSGSSSVDLPAGASTSGLPHNRVVLIVKGFIPAKDLLPASTNIITFHLRDGSIVDFADPPLSMSPSDFFTVEMKPERPADGGGGGAMPGILLLLLALRRLSSARRTSLPSE